MKHAWSPQRWTVHNWAVSVTSVGQFQDLSPGFKLYAGGSWLAWVTLSSYLNVDLCDRGKDSGLGWLLGTL